ncbi:MAG: hypothetical protein ACRCX2_27100 [Paraclostridium sp.]
MKILDFKYSDKSTFAILESSKGVKIKVKFSIDGIETEKDYPAAAINFIKEFLLSREVLDFYDKWQYSLSTKVKWIGDVVYKSLCELETGSKFYNSNFRKKSNAVYRPHY